MTAEIVAALLAVALIVQSLLHARERRSLIAVAVARSGADARQYAKVLRAEPEADGEPHEPRRHVPTLPVGLAPR